MTKRESKSREREIRFKVGQRQGGTKLWNKSNSEANLAIIKV